MALANLYAARPVPQNWDMTMAGALRSNILLIEDTYSMASIYEEYLRQGPYDVRHCSTGRAALLEIAHNPPDAVLLDLRLPDMDGLDVLRHMKERRLQSAVVVITADGSINTAVEAMREGAHDFLVKPFNADRLLITLKNVLERRRLNTAVETLSVDMRRSEFYGFIGASQPMQDVYRMIAAASPSKATVFITGESGTGKEVAAEAIHALSPRATNAFVPINCTAIPKDLLESALFGHVKGAFTGAVSGRDGAAATADKGTLFLDEICEMPLDLQPKLLRFLETGTFQQVGSDKVEQVDVRILCATNRDPAEEVRLGRFREDLYYRLHVVNLALPPLRERGADIMQIAQHFLVHYAQKEGKSFDKFSHDVEVLFMAYHWPGNVRQLQNVIRNIVVLHQGNLVTADMLPLIFHTAPSTDARRLHLIESAAGASATPASQIAASMRKSDESGGPESIPAARVSGAPLSPPGKETIAAQEEQTIRPLWLVEKEAIEQAIRICDGNVARAAALLGVNPSTLYRKRLSWQAAETGNSRPAGLQGN